MYLARRLSLEKLKSLGLNILFAALVLFFVCFVVVSFKTILYFAAIILDVVFAAILVGVLIFALFEVWAQLDNGN